MYRVDQAQQERTHPTLLVIPPPVGTPGYEGGWEVPLVLSIKDEETDWFLT